jgi:hypothetical protein
LSHLHIYLDGSLHPSCINGPQLSCKDTNSSIRTLMDRSTEDTAPLLEPAAHIVATQISNLLADQDFQQIHDKIKRFNFFEAIGAQRREVRHSDFLAFLLDPKGNHGFGDGFLRRFLKRSLKTELNYPGPGDFQIERETRHVDILVHNDKHRLAVIIENKIDSEEHDNQLQRYWNETRNLYPGYLVYGIYLTPEGEKPEGSAEYVSFSYSDVGELVDELRGGKEFTHAPAVDMALAHYVEMLRRDIVLGSDLRQLCETVYFKHRDVLDKIFEFKPDLQAVVRDYLTKLIASEPGRFVVARSDKEHLRFGVREWDLIKALNLGRDEWERRILWFQFDNQVSSLRLRLIIGPGPDNIRRALLALALADNSVMKATDRELNANWNGIYSRHILSKSSLADSSTHDLEERISTEWRQFVEDDFMKIRALVSSVEWEKLVQPDSDTIINAPHSV